MILSLLATCFMCLISCSSNNYEQQENNKQEKNIQYAFDVTTEYDYDYRIVNETQALLPFYTILSPQFAFNTLTYFKTNYPSYNFGVDRNTNSTTIRVNFSNYDNTRVSGQSGILDFYNFFESSKIDISTQSFTDYFVGISFQQRANETKNLIRNAPLTYNVQKYYLNFLSSSGTSLRLAFYIFHGPIEYHSANLTFDYPGYFVQSEIAFQGGVYDYSYYLDYMFIFDSVNAKVFYDILNLNVTLATQPYYDSGYNAGYYSGFDASFDAGYDLGKQEGYTNGVLYAQSQNQTALTIFTGIIDVGLLPINVFLAMFNYEVFGINIAGLVSSLLTVGIVVIVIRIFIGGNKND